MLQTCITNELHDYMQSAEFLSWLLLFVIITKTINYGQNVNCTIKFEICNKHVIKLFNIYYPALSTL